MPPTGKRVVVGSALLSAALMVAVAGAAPALAGTDRAASAVSAQDPADYSYTMLLSSTSATIHPGRTTTTGISFDASRRLHGAVVDLSISGLPASAHAFFSPPNPRVGGHSTLTITTASTTPTGEFTVTVGAIINNFGIDPIGTTTPFDLTIGAG